MTRARSRPRRASRTATGLILGLSIAVATLSHTPVGAAEPPPDGGSATLSRDWRWPVQPFRLERAFVAPAHPYGRGHRGADLRPLSGDAVSAPAGGVVAFSGAVAGRGILTIDHGDGLVSTLEPVDSDLAPGTPVEAGSVVGHVATGGHTSPGLLHLGVRLYGEYINPLLLLGGVPRAVLLPCC